MGCVQDGSFIRNAWWDLYELFDLDYFARKDLWHMSDIAHAGSDRIYTIYIINSGLSRWNISDLEILHNILSGSRCGLDGLDHAPTKPRL